MITSKILALSIALCAAVTVWAQSVEEKKAAAQRWLAQEEIKINYAGSSYSSVFTVDMKAMTVRFYGSPDRFCSARPVPASVTVAEDGTVDFVFDRKLPGCEELKYAFDPISREGVLSVRPGGSAPDAPWTRSASKISLKEPS